VPFQKVEAATRNKERLIEMFLGGGIAFFTNFEHFSPLFTRLTGGRKEKVYRQRSEP
jgi:hypothetical protein